MTPIEQLEAATKIQCSDGNWNYDPYMHGMANGMIFALATLRGEQPQYLDSPEKWLCDDTVTCHPETVDGAGSYGPATETNG